MKGFSGNLTIEGPVSISEYFSPQLQKHIYLIADVHVRKMKCPDPSARTLHLTDFLAMTFRDNRDKIVDFYLEQSYAPNQPFSNERSKESYLKDVKERFKECYQLNQLDPIIDCQFRHVRFHQVDIRRRSSIGTSIEELHGALFRLFVSRDSEITDRRLAIVKELGLEIIEYLKANNILDIMRQNKILKQYENIADSRIREITHDYWLRQGKNLYRRLKTMIPYSQGISAESYERDFRPVSVLLTVLFEFGIFIMDAYTSGRIFRSFKLADDPKYIIVYAGRTHITNYASFFEYLGLGLVGKNSSDVEGEDFQCLRLGLRLPFFHHKPEYL
jgi:hypothetical protein